MKFQIRKILVKFLDRLMIVIGILAIISLIAEYGFYLKPETEAILHILDEVILIYFVAQSLLKLILATDRIGYLKARLFNFILVFFILLQYLLFSKWLNIQFFQKILETLNILQITKGYIVIVQILLVLSLIVGAARYNKSVARLKFRPAQTFVISFILVILTGAFALMLPRSTVGTGSMRFIDAVFTSVSATCVTGLTIYDTGTYFTLTGQLIILFLIQIGGLGLITFSTFFSMIFAGGSAVKEQLMIREILNEESISEVGKALGKILLITFVIEMIGALILYYHWEDIFPGDKRRLYLAIFHSISAFCNAGFSLFPDGLMNFQTDIVINMTIMLLIVVGGLGFAVITDILNYRFYMGRQKRMLTRLSLQAKLVLIITSGLIMFGTILFFILEYNGALKELSLGNKILVSFFQSIVPRTAGFNTVDFSQIFVSTSLIVIILMFIGASPGSTGGGVKTSTVGVLYASIRSILKGRRRVEIFKKNIPFANVNNALIVVIFSMIFTGVAIFMLSLTENAPLIDIIFEEFSAFGTVGLSRGLTPNLSDSGKVIICLSMFVGRVGPMTLALALASYVDKATYEYPEESVMIG
jgi:potassium uptake TrkH family protein